jgi:hypothetical protein
MLVCESDGSSSSSAWMKIFSLKTSNGILDRSYPISGQIALRICLMGLPGAISRAAAAALLGFLKHFPADCQKGRAKEDPFRARLDRAATYRAHLSEYLSVSSEYPQGGS